MARRRRRTHHAPDQGGPLPGTGDSPLSMLGVEPGSSPVGDPDLDEPFEEDDLDPEQLSEEDREWFEAATGRPANRGYSGLMMRHPLLLVIVMALGVFTIYRFWPQASLYFSDPMTRDFGEITERLDLKASGKPVPEFVHDQFGRMSGTVESASILFQGDEEDVSTQRYFVKIFGANVFLVIQATRKDVVLHKNLRSSLAGFGFDETGRLIEATVDPSWREIVATLRHGHQLDPQAKVWLFDTTDTPSTYWPYLFIICFAGAVILLALFGLGRFARRRQAA